MTTANYTLFPADPKHEDIFELRPGLLYQFDAGVNSWVRIVSSNLILPLVSNIADGAMAALDLKKLNRLVIPPPRSTIVGNDCVAPFQSGAIGLFGGDNFVNVEGDLSLQNIDSVGDVINEEFPFQIHQHTYGYDFNLDIPLLVAELNRRGQLDTTGTIGKRGVKGAEGEPGLDEILTGPQGDGGERGNAPECVWAIEPEAVQAQPLPSLDRALVEARLIPSVTFPTDPTKFSIELDRQVIGRDNATTSRFMVRQRDSLWVLAVASISGTAQEIFYFDVEPLIETVRQKFLAEVELLKKGYEDIVAFWIQTMSDLFDEQKDALCCALECCRSRSKSTQLRQHMESVAASALPNAKINLSGRKSDEAEEIPSTKLLSDSECYDPLIKADEACGSSGGGDDTLEIDDSDKDPVVCDSGMDVVFVLDDTSSMSKTINEMKSQVRDYVNHIKSISGGNYRLGLITFKDADEIDIDVGMSDNNEAQFIAGMGSVIASGGGDGPEAHVEATQQAVDGDAGNWRPTSAKIIITITDSRPGAGDTAAIPVANKAKSQDIRISGIQVPVSGGGFLKGPEVSLKYYTSITGGVFIKSSSNRAEDAIIDGALTVCKEGGDDGGLPVVKSDFTVKLAVDPIINAGSANNGASVEIPAGDYVATIIGASASVNGMHKSNVRLQYAKDGQRRASNFLDKGEFSALIDGRNAYEGLTLPFSHDGGTASFYFPIIPQKRAAGEVQIQIQQATPIVQKAAVEVEEQPKTRKRPRKTEKIIPVSDGTLTCLLDTSHLRWYERGWQTGNCCGLVVDLGGQEYIVVKRSLDGDDNCGGGENDSTPCIKAFKEKYGHPSFAWPTLDGKTFAPIQDVDQVSFRYDQTLNDLVAQRIAASEYNSPKGNPNGIRHLTFQLMTILFPTV
jgi:hypothetical protein